MFVKKINTYKPAVFLWAISFPLTFNSLWKEAGALPRYTGDMNCCIDFNSAPVSWPSWALIPSTTNRNFFFSRLKTTCKQCSYMNGYLPEQWAKCRCLVVFCLNICDWDAHIHWPSAISHHYISLGWRSPSVWLQTVWSDPWTCIRPGETALLWLQQRTTDPQKNESWHPERSGVWRKGEKNRILWNQLSILCIPKCFCVRTWPLTWAAAPAEEGCSSGCWQAPPRGRHVELELVTRKTKRFHLSLHSHRPKVAQRQAREAFQYKMEQEST